MCVIISLSKDLLNIRKRWKMDLIRYDYKRVRVIVQDDPDRFSDPAIKDDPEFSRYFPFIHSLGDGNMEMTGIACESPADYGLHEFGRQEESINVCGYQIFESEIKDIELITNMIDDYIASRDQKIRKLLDSVRATIADTILDAEEKISWGMPTWYRKHNLIHFAAQKHHIGLYPGPEAVEHFSAVLNHKGFKYSKGAIQIPYDKVELDLVEMIAEYCGREGGTA